MVQNNVLKENKKEFDKFNREVKNKMEESSTLVNRFSLRDNASPLQHNILSELHKNGPMTRRDLVKKLNKARTTVYDNLLKLQKINVVTRFARNNGDRGRPMIFWKLSTE